MEKGEVILYQPDETIKLEVRLEAESVWLTQAQMAELFQTTPQNITIHVKSIYSEKELEIEATCKEHLQVRKEGNRMVQRKHKFYNLDVIISVGYRVKSIYGTRFRQWANNILKEYLLKGYTINNRLQTLERTPINIKTYKRSHDRFILIDGKELYHIGASLKDLGKKIFAFSKMNASTDIILQLLANNFSQ